MENVTSDGNLSSNEFGSNEFESIMALIRKYLDALHYGDVSKLRDVFHQDVFLKAPGFRRSFEQWLQAVAKRPVPSQQGLPYAFKLLSIEIIKDQAMVKLECPLVNNFYVDFLGLLKENGRWIIVNKMYADIQECVS